MEIAKIDVSRADARKVYCQTLTSGMAGVEVTFSFDDAWDGLHRIATFKAGGTAKDVLLTDDRCEIPWEVLAKPGIQLVVGVYGERADGTLVIPTVWAELGRVEQGVTPSGDISGKHTPEVWAQILGMIGNLEELDSENKETLVAAINEVAKAAGLSPDPGGDAYQGGLSAAQVSALDNMFKVCAFIKNDVSAEYSAFKAAFGIEDSGEVEPDEPDTEKTLTGISAVYSGGEVAVGTAVTALTGIVVTAHYSDGTSATVTGYTLSGTIAEGSNTVTVSYGGKTTTFVVIGAVSGDDVPTLETYEYSWDNPGKVVGPYGELQGNGAYNSTGFIDLDDGAESLTVYTDPVGEFGPYVGFFASDGTFVERHTQRGAILICSVPTGATKFIVTVQTTVTTTTIYKGAVTADQI